jgi:hypothetical protein
MIQQLSFHPPDDLFLHGCPPEHKKTGLMTDSVKPNGAKPETHTFGAVESGSDNNVIKNKISTKTNNLNQM